MIGNRLPLILSIVVLVLAGCGGDDGEGTATSDGSAAGGRAPRSGYGYAPPPPNAEEGTTFVSLGNVPGLGLVLVDSNGRTLYDFRKDRGGESSCYGACATAWPPLLTEGEPQPSNGASAAKLGTAERRDGSVQVTYAGRPLYTYAGDRAPGEANGHDITRFGAEWYALKASGAGAEG